MKRLLSFVLLLLILSAAVCAQSGEDVFNSAITSYQDGRYSQALTEFRQLLLDPQYASFRGDAYFWIAKVLIAQNRISDAERNLEFFISNFPENKNYPEGMYQRGRILFMNADWESSIQAFSDFINTYPNSPFVANAYYWTGEALFSLGQLDDAEKMFNAVIEEFPTSYRVEASRYRISVIVMNRREQELLKLLQWTQQESIRTIEEFRRQQASYQEAISSYQERLANLSDDSFKEEIDGLMAQVDQLKELNASLQARIDEYSNTIRKLENEMRSYENSSISAAQQQPETVQINTNDADFALRVKLLSLKEQSLDVKAQLIDELQQMIRDMQGEEN